MKTYIFFLCLIWLPAINIYAQTSTATPDSGAAMRREEEQRRQADAQQIALEQQRQRQRIEDQERRLRALSDRENSVNENSSNSRVSWQAIQNLNALYRKTTKEELKSIAPDKQDVAQFADFLRQENTGLIKLAADRGCADNPAVLVVTTDCLAYTMPGNGSSYSFRVKDYRIQRLADITFYKNSFQATGIRLHGIFVAIGDIPLEQVNLQTKGAEFLVDFTPESDFQKAKDIDERLSKGVESDGFLYRRAVAARDNMTYLLRSVAYRGTYLRAVSGITYNELDLDKRNDTIVAFRIVRRYDDNSVLILWKRLSKKDSPKTNWKKDGKDSRDKSSDFTAVIK